MDQGCTAANTNHHPSSSLQHHTALHINPLSSSSKAQRDVGRLWQVSQNEHTCTTKPFSDTIAKQGTEEDVGAKFDIPTPPKKKQSHEEEDEEYFFCIFVRLEKPLKQKSDHLVDTRR